MLKRKFYKSSIPALMTMGLMSLSSPASAQQVDWSLDEQPQIYNQDVEQQVQELLATMTIEQKVAQMIQPEIGYLSVEQMRKYGFGSYLNGGNTAPYGMKQADRNTWLRYADEMYEASIDDAQDGSSIPTLWGTDAMHGHSNVFGATLFPHNIGLGAARNPELVKKIGEATAKEVAATGIEWSFSPTVAVARDDRWGRAYESYSEDPEIVRQYAAAVVEGIQGAVGEGFLKDHHRIATAKHFIGDGGTTRGIDRGDTRVDESTLREIHGAGYVSALEAGVQSVMASFNSWNGTRVHGHNYLLTDVLKEQMEFDGFVISDWNAHKFVDGCDLEQCAAAINAGIDVLMAPEHFEALYHNTVAQVKSGVIPQARIDDAVTRILRVKVRWGLFDRDKPSRRPETQHAEWFNAKQHRELAAQAVRESLVLLKNNDQVLPLSPKANILVAGQGANTIAMQAGGWSVSWQGTDNTNADFPNATSIYRGIEQQVVAAGGTVTLSETGEFDTRPDAAIVVFGEQPYAEWFGDIQSLDFGQVDSESYALLKRLSDQGIPTVSVFLSGRPLWVNKELNVSDAFVAAWLPGSEGQGVADVILRDANGAIQHDFTGKLSFSWPKFDDQFTLNRYDNDYDPLFPYGYGLTYQDNQHVDTLHEEKRLKDSQSAEPGSVPLFVRNLADGWYWGFAEANGNLSPIVGPSGANADEHSVTMQSVNLAYQEDGRRFVWHEAESGVAAILASEDPIESFAHRDARFLQATVRFSDNLSGPVSVGVLCHEKQCSNEVQLSESTPELKRGDWNTLAIEAGCENNEVSQGASIMLSVSSPAKTSLSIADVALVSEPSEQALTVSCN
ncbi:glycoside hydrolase family 3 protein [Idiomarina sp.]|uniref:glycoside hydrolase family 3 protein n=1 Tax=Idiomarina sp. TaxID=1874361 RepID=UPI0025BD50BD|nr:glycoside hydrolase family 3 protein [Idiomarina sp.]